MTDKLNIRWKAAEYRRGFHFIAATWGGTPLIGVSSSVAAVFGAPAVTMNSEISALGFSSAQFGTPQTTTDKQYIRPDFYVKGSWYQAEKYRTPSYQIAGVWGDLSMITPLGVDYSAFGGAKIFKHLFVSGRGFDSQQIGGHAVLFNWQYVAPKQFVTGTWFGAGKYNIPDGGAVNGVWTIPTRGQLAAYSFDSGIVSDGLSAKNKNAYIKPFSYNETDDFGSPKIINAAVGIKALSVGQTDSFSEPWISNFTRELKTVGWADFDEEIKRLKIEEKYKLSRIFNRNSYLKLGDKNRNLGIAPPEWKFDRKRPMFVSHYVRGFEVGGFEALKIGNAWVSFGVRVVDLDLNGIKNPDMSERHYVSPPRIIGSEGFEATQWLERIIPEAQAVYPKEIDTLWGTPYVGHWKRYISFLGAPQIYGEVSKYNKIYNSDQYIIQYRSEEVADFTVPPDFTKDYYTFVENGNKEAKTAGFPFDRYGYLVIRHVAELLRLRNGIDGLSFGKQYVGYRLRHYALEGWDSLFGSEYHAIENRSFVVAPSGIAPSNTFGADIKTENTRRYFRFYGFSSFRYGFPSVDFRVRSIVADEFYSIQPPTFPLPAVGFFNRRITPKTIGDLSAFGGAFLEERFNIISPRWAYNDRNFGIADTRNVNRLVKTWGTDWAEWGRPKIENLTSQVWAQSHEPFDVVSRYAVVSHRTRYIRPNGAAIRNFSTRHVVAWDGSRPFSTQNIWLDGLVDTNGRKSAGRGIDLSSGGFRFGYGRVHANSIYPDSGEMSFMKIGKAAVHANSIIIESGIFDHYIGEPDLTNGARVLGLKDKGIEPPKSDSGFRKGIHNVSHNTIWAMGDAPQQAKRNHEFKGIFKPVSTGIVLGNAKLENSRRYLTVHTSNTREQQYVPVDVHRNGMFESGAHTVDFRKRHIRAVGFRREIFGWTKLLPFTETAEVYDSPDSAAVGQHRIHYSDGDKTQRITFGKDGYLDGLSIGKTRIELFNRNIYPSGFSEAVFGKSDYRDTPYMWQHLRVGFFVPTAISGGDMTLWGDTFVSLWNREVHPDGIDGFTSRYTPKDFAKRMRVRRVSDNPPNNRQRNNNAAVSAVQVIGGDGVLFGDSGIRNAAHFIHPDGFADQFRKGASIWLNMP